MAWNWPILTSLFGPAGGVVNDWLAKYGWVFWVILILIIAIVGLYAFSVLRRR